MEPQVAFEEGPLGGAWRNTLEQKSILAYKVLIDQVEAQEDPLEVLGGPHWRADWPPQPSPYQGIAGEAVGSNVIWRNLLKFVSYWLSENKLCFFTPNQ